MARAFSSSSRTVGRPNGSLFSLACVHKVGGEGGVGGRGWEKRKIVVMNGTKGTKEQAQREK